MSFLSRDPVIGNSEIYALVQGHRWQDAKNILIGILSEAVMQADSPPPTTGTALETTTGPLDDSPDTQSAKLMLAHIFRQVGQPQDAELLDSEVLQTRQRLLGPDAEGTLWVMHHLATDIKLQPGRLLEGLILEKRVLESAVNIYWFDEFEGKRGRHGNAATSSNSPAMDILNRMCHLADTFFLQNQAAYAAKLHETVLRLCTMSLGPGNPYTIAVMDSTGRDYVSQGRFLEAVRLLQDAVEASRVHLGTRDPTTRRCVVHLAEVNGRITAEGDGNVPDAKAIAILEEGVQILQESIGADKADTISLKYYLGIAYTRVHGRFRDSEVLLGQVLLWCQHRYRLSDDTEAACLMVRNLVLMYRDRALQSITVAP
ncbi:hypothetical protein ZTR_09064 [Talaromyces verruculosus]|nr:hypothetical protein ZTR_09064 [Talaromyces verruculosus]